MTKPNTPPAAPAAPASNTPPAAPAAPAAPVSTPADNRQAMLNLINKTLSPAASAPADPAPAAPESKPPVTDEKQEPAGKTSVFAKDKPAAPPTESADAPEDKLPEPGDEKAKANFVALRTTTKQLRTELQAERANREALAKQIEQLKAANGGDAAEVERLRSEHKAAMDRLAAADLSQHPEFIRAYTKPQEAAVREAGEVLKYNGKDGVDVGALLAKPLKEFNAEVSKLTDGLNSMDATTVQTSLRTAYRLAAESREALNGASTLSKQLSERAAAANRAAFDKTFAEITSTMADVIKPLSAPEGATPEAVEAVKAFNAAVGGLRANAERIAFAPSGPQDVATNATKAALLDLLVGHVYPQAEREHAELIRVNASLLQEIRALKAARGAGTSAGDPKSGAGAQPHKTLSDLVSSTYRR